MLARTTNELFNLTIDDIQDVISSVIVNIPGTKNKVSRIFNKNVNMFGLYRKYAALQLSETNHRFFFLYFIKPKNTHFG